MSILHLPQISRWTAHLLCRVENAPGRFALTFDDGPNPRATPEILDLLRRHRARATFFLLAGNMRRWPDLVRRLVGEGHEPALHGAFHWPLLLLPRGAVRRDVERSAVALAAVCEIPATHFRPPFGVMTRAQSARVREMGYVSVLGDVYPEDPHRPGVGRIVDRVMGRLASGSILILHDGSPIGEVDRSQTVEALGIILERAARAGLSPVTVRELREAGARGA